MLYKNSTQCFGFWLRVQERTIGYVRVTDDGSAVRARLEIDGVGADSTTFNC